MQSNDKKEKLALVRGDRRCFLAWLRVVPLVVCVVRFRPDPLKNQPRRMPT
jgi:hypothetical protein